MPFFSAQAAYKNSYSSNELIEAGKRQLQNVKYARDNIKKAD